MFVIFPVGNCCRADDESLKDFLYRAAFKAVLKANPFVEQIWKK